MLALNERLLCFCLRSNDPLFTCLYFAEMHILMIERLYLLFVFLHVENISVLASVKWIRIDV